MITGPAKLATFTRNLGHFWYLRQPSPPPTAQGNFRELLCRYGSCNSCFWEPNTHRLQRKFVLSCWQAKVFIWEKFVMLERVTLPTLTRKDTFTCHLASWGTFSIFIQTVSWIFQWTKSKVCSTRVIWRKVLILWKFCLKRSTKFFCQCWFGFFQCFDYQNNSLFLWL